MLNVTKSSVNVVMVYFFSESIFFVELNGVLEVCVVGIPHHIDWEHAKAFIVRRPNFEITENQIIAYVKGTVNKNVFQVLE